MLASLLLVATWSTPALAYVGPGAGLSVIGTTLALVAGLFAAVFGFLWYPVKRLLRHRRRRAALAEADRTRDP